MHALGANLANADQGTVCVEKGRADNEKSATGAAKHNFVQLLQSSNYRNNKFSQFGFNFLILQHLKPNFLRGVACGRMLSMCRKISFCFSRHAMERAELASGD
jgi:hypothetical protein